MYYKFIYQQLNTLFSMKKIYFITKRTSVQPQRLLMMMATILMAFATLTACDDIFGDKTDENGKEEEGGNGGGGVSGKRLKTTLITEASGEIHRGEHTYNNDGSLKRVDWYDASSKLISYDIYTNNTDGTHNKWENFNTHGNQVLVFTYDSNKKPLKAEGTIGEGPLIYEYTFQNGRLIRHVMKIGNIGAPGYVEDKFEPEYDSNGRRTTTTETHSIVGTRKYTRTYNSDGTLQKVIADDYAGYANTGFTQTFTWENGKTTVKFDDFSSY